MQNRYVDVRMYCRVCDTHKDDVTSADKCKHVFEKLTPLTDQYLLGVGFEMSEWGDRADDDQCYQIEIGMDCFLEVWPDNWSWGIVEDTGRYVYIPEGLYTEYIKDQKQLEALYHALTGDYIGESARVASLPSEAYSTVAR